MDETSTFLLDPEWEAPAGSAVPPATAVIPVSPAPAPAQEVAPDASGFTLEGSGFEDQSQPNQPKVSTLEDVGRTVAAEGFKGFTVDAPGMLGAAAYYTQPELTEAQLEDLYRELTPDQLLDIQEGKLTAIPVPRETSPYKVLPMGGMGAFAPPQKGKSFNLVPTMQGTASNIEKNFPFTQWEAQNGIADVLGAGTRAFTSTAMMGAPSQAPLAFLSGSVGRGAGIGVSGLSGGDPTAEFGAELGTNILVDVLSRRLGKVAYDLAAPNSAAFDKILDGMRVKMSAEPEKAKLLLQAIREGRDVKVSELMDQFLDQNTKDWISKNLPGDYASSVIQLNDTLFKRSDEISAETARKFTNIFGEDMTDSGWQEALKKSLNDETTRLYKEVRANPASSNIYPSSLKTLIDKGGVIQKAALEVTDRALKGELDDNIVPLTVTKGKKGAIDIDPNSQPNFDFWDRVKRNLDGKAGEAYKANNSDLGKVYSDAAKSVRQKVSDVIGKYPEAREAGQKAIQTPTSLEEGYNFANTLTNPKINLEKVDDFFDKYDGYNAEQQMRVQQGFGRALFQIGEKGDFTQISRLMSSRPSRKALLGVLGPEKFNEVYGLIAQNALMKKKAEVAAAINDSNLKAKASSNPLFRDLAAIATGGGGAGAAGAVAANYLQSPEAMLGGALVALVTTGAFATKAAFNSKERAVAAEVMRLATSDKKDDAVKLAELFSSNPAAVTAYRKSLDVTQNLVRTGLLTSARNEDRKREQSEATQSMSGNNDDFFAPDQIPGFNNEQSRGGRIERKSGGRVANAISNEVARTRALLSNKTASMLSMPDDAIVTALNHAKNT